MHDKYTKCIVCESSRFENKYIVNGFTIVKCKECSLLFVKEKLTQKELNSYYERSDDDCVYSDPENIENLKYYYLKLRALIESRITKGKILDIGCSEGHFLDVMEGWDRYGIELPNTYAETAKAKYGDNIHIGTLEDYECRDPFFDIITMQDVLDHLIDPLLALKKCHSLLKPSGLIVIKVHNLSCLLARITGAGFYALIPPFHLSYFNRTSLQEALSKTGFEIIYHKYIAHILFLKTIPYRLARGRKSGFFHSLHRLLSRSSIGNIKIKKNLHDIITVVAKKQI